MANPPKVDPEAPLQEGEFRRIKGIAVTTEQALHSAGIKTFERLAALSPEEIAAALPKAVGVKERVVRDDWMGQAANFARALAEIRQPEPADEAEERQHYASFMVVLLLDEGHSVRRTTVNYVQAEEREIWAGWEPQRLVSWIADQAGVASARPAIQQEPIVDHAAPGALSGELQLSPVRLISPVIKRPLSIIHAGDPFAVYLTLDLSQVSGPPGVSLRFQAAAKARRIGEHDQPVTGQVEGAIPPGDRGPLEIPLPGLAAGGYYLDVAVQVSPVDSANPERDALCAVTEGILVRVQAEELLATIA